MHLHVGGQSLLHFLRGRCIALFNGGRPHLRTLYLSCLLYCVIIKAQQPGKGQPEHVVGPGHLMIAGWVCRSWPVELQKSSKVTGRVLYKQPKMGQLYTFSEFNLQVLVEKTCSDMEVLIYTHITWFRGVSSPPLWFDVPIRTRGTRRRGHGASFQRQSAPSRRTRCGSSLTCRTSD